MSASFYLNLIICAGSLVAAWLDHGETFSNFKVAAGRERRWKGLKLVLLWGVPAVSLITTVISAMESVASDERGERQEARLAQTESNLTLTRVELDPRKQRVSSMSAFVELTVRGVPRDRAPMGGYNDVVHPAQLYLGRSSEIHTNLWIVRLIADKFIKWSADTSIYSMEFHMNPHMPLWNAKSNKVEDILALDVLKLDAWFLPGSSEVMSGTATIIVNASIKKTFEIPAQTTGPEFFSTITSVFQEQNRAQSQQ